MKNNLYKFDILVCNILDERYVELTITCDLEPESFCIKNAMREFLETIDGVMDDAKELTFFEATVSWLLENEIMTAKSSGFGSYYDARLTMNGLKLLKSTPKSVDSDRKSIGESLKELSKAGANESLKIAVNTLFSYGLSKIGLA